MEIYQKKIAIVTHQMVMGGIEKSLIELCKALLEKNIEITLYLEVPGGELYNEIPEDVKIVSIFEKYNNMKQVLKTFLRERQFRKSYALIESYIINKLEGNPVKGWIETAKYLEDEQVIYDYAFAYGAPLAFSTIYVIKNIRANKKYAWIHSDPECISLDIRKEKKYLKNYDKLICVSESTKNKMDKIIPEYASKTEVFYNIIDRNVIKIKANETIAVDEFTGSRLLTVGRLSEEKGQDIIPEIMKKLIRDNYNIKWYCVGEGELHSQLNELIEKAGLQDKVILLGNKNNPYPYFKIADIYVQPSRHEAFGITLTEAKILNLPIITTNFDGASEQIKNGETGYIVNFDVDEIYYTIKKMLDNGTDAKKFKDNLKQDSKNCISDIEKLLS